MALVAAYPQFLYRNTCHNYQVGEIRKVSSFSRGEITELVQLLKSQSRAIKHSDGRSVKVQVFWQNVDRPTSVEMELISSEEQLDQVLDEALQHSQPIVIDWMATWCGKCIYLKPKLEKLAAEFYPKIKFYYVNVNSVPQALVKRAGISLWKNGEKQAEVIGGHKAWLVVEEVREMIEKH